MHFFVTALYLRLKQTVMTKFFIVSAMLSFLLTLACGAFFASQPNGTAIGVGLIIDSSSPVQRMIYDNFASGGNIRVTVFSSRAQLEKSVMNATLECGYILNDVDAKLLARDYTDFATLIESPASMLTGFTNELFYSAVFKSISGNIAYDYLTDAGAGISLGEIQNEIQSYYDSGVFMDTVNVNAGVITGSRNISLFGAGWVLRGVVALSAFIFVYFSMIHFFGKRRDEVNDRLENRRQALDSAARLIAVLISAILSSLGGIICAAFFLPAICHHALYEAASYLLYLVCLTGIGYLAAFLLGGAVMYSIFSIAFVAAMVFGGYLLDMNGVNESLGKVQSVFPGAWYEAAVSGSPKALLTCCAAVIILCALTVFLDTKLPSLRA